MSALAYRRQPRAPVIAGIVLAGGEGRRMGGHPKAGICLEGSTLLDHVVRCLRRSGCSSIAAVLPVGHPDLFEHARHIGIAPISNPKPSDGMFSSVRLGIRHFVTQNARVAALVLFPVDHPRVRHQTVSTLLAFARQSGAAAVRPSYDGRGGHPIVLTTGLALRLLLLPPTSTLREALSSCTPLCTIPTRDAGVCMNVNTPADLSELTAPRAPAKALPGPM